MQLQKKFCTIYDSCHFSDKSHCVFCRSRECLNYCTLERQNRFISVLQHGMRRLEYTGCYVPVLP